MIYSCCPFTYFIFNKDCFVGSLMGYSPHILGSDFFIYNRGPIPVRIHFTISGNPDSISVIKVKGHSIKYDVLGNTFFTFPDVKGPLDLMVGLFIFFFNLYILLVFPGFILKFSEKMLIL